MVPGPCVVMAGVSVVLGAVVVSWPDVVVVAGSVVAAIISEIFRMTLLCDCKRFRLSIFHVGVP